MEKLCLFASRVEDRPNGSLEVSNCTQFSECSLQGRANVKVWEYNVFKSRDIRNPTVQTMVMLMLMMVVIVMMVIVMTMMTMMTMMMTMMMMM